MSLMEKTKNTPPEKSSPEEVPSEKTPPKEQLELSGAGFGFGPEKDDAFDTSEPAAEWWSLLPAAVLVGLVAALLVLAFRWLIESGQMAFLPDGVIGNYEALPPALRFALPIGGALVLAAVMSRLAPQTRQVGIAHVIDRLTAQERVQMPWRNAVLQFFAGAFAIITGHSVDREGPAVHLGTLAGNWLLRWRNLTDLQVRTLTLSGAGAAIAASFNTPLAGVVFVLEVLHARYEMSRFVLIILACVTGAVVGRVFYGHQPLFELPPVSLAHFSELWLILLIGLVIGVIASTMISGAARVARLSHGRSLYISFALAGLLTGLLGQVSPQIHGVSYDTLARLMHDQSFPLMALMLLVSAKLIATTVSVGVGIPGGLIGPSLVIGGALGALMGTLPTWFGLEASSTAFYAVVGMIAMMSVTLRAPLAALVALLELTGNPNLLLPGMLVVVAADTMARLLVGRHSVFMRLLAVRKDA